MWEQFSLAAFLQRYWADNQVSSTITFDAARDAKNCARALDFFQYQLKGISLLPRMPKAAYKQMPYEAIDELTYRAAVSAVRPAALSLSGVHSTRDAIAPDPFCGNDGCEILA